MFKTEMQKISDASEKKIAFMKDSPLSYIVYRLWLEFISALESC